MRRYSRGVALLTFSLGLVVYCLRLACLPGPRCILEEDRIIYPTFFGDREFEYAEILKVTTSNPLKRKHRRPFNELLIYTMDEMRPWRLDISGIPEQEELFTTIDDIVSWLHTEKLDRVFVQSMDQLARTTPDIVKSKLQKALLKQLFGAIEDITFEVTPRFITLTFVQLSAFPVLIATACFLISRRVPFSFSVEYLTLMVAGAALLPFFIRPLLLLFRSNPPFILHHDILECAGVFNRQTFFLKEIRKCKADSRDMFYLNIKNRKYLQRFPAAGLNPPAHMMEYALNALLHISEKDFLSFRELIERDVRFQDARDEYLAQRSSAASASRLSMVPTCSALTVCKQKVIGKTGSSISRCPVSRQRQHLEETCNQDVILYQRSPRSSWQGRKCLL